MKILFFQNVSKVLKTILKHTNIENYILYNGAVMIIKKTGDRSEGAHV